MQDKTGAQAMRRGWGLLASLGVAAAATAALSQVPSSQSPTAAGKAVYAAQCATCHGAALQGGSGPSLSDTNFQAKWAGHDLHDLQSLIGATMPYGGDKLSDVDYAAVTAYIVSTAGLDGAVDRLRGTGAKVAAMTNTVKLVSGPPVANVSPRPFEPTFAGKAGAASSAAPTDAELRDVPATDWLTFNRDLKGIRYSPLNQITPANAANLKMKCAFQLGEVGAFQNSPIVYKGVIYINDRAKTFAIDGRNCHKIWDHEWIAQNVDNAIADARGVALYDGKVFRGTADGHLIALDAATGKLLWDTTVHDSKAGYSISSAVAAYEGKVFVGEGGGDKGIRGRAWAFDANSGKPIWAFDLIPTGSEKGADTWKGGQDRGGASVWSTMTIDPKRDQVITPTGNPGPDYDGSVRLGDNLFTDSIVALDIKTGKLAWYDQQIPHDTHDSDTAAAPTLYERGGKGYVAVTQKNGRIYVYDQDNHKELFQALMAPKYVEPDLPTNFAKPIDYCGGHGQYNGAGYDPVAGVLFTGSEFKCGTIQAVHQDYVPGQNYYAGRTTGGLENSTGFIQAFDATTGKKLWGVASRTAINAAVTPTAGGVLFTGDVEGNLIVLDQQSGKPVFTFFTGGAVSGGLSVYGVDGQEMVAVTTGNSSRATRTGYGSATLMVFGL